MKLMKKLFSIMTICFLLVLVVSCDVTHTHRYMDWTVTTEPTMDTEGVATRECSCGEKEEYTLPILADTGFWTVTTEDATCQKEGTVTYTSEFGTVVTKNSVAEHEYTYEITTDPTLDVEGAATATCKYGETKDVTLPALTDTSVWTVKETVDSTCSVKGSKTFTSIYGDVTIELALEEHEYTYAITTNPTLDTEGAATATCKYGETKDVTVPALSDEIWSSKVTEEPTYVNGGKITYTSMYGDVVVETPRLTASYENKTYYATCFDSRGSDGKYYFNELKAQSDYIGDGVTVDEDGKTVKADFPFSYDFTFEMVNGTTGELVIKYLNSSSDTKTYNGFIDSETGIIVILNIWNERAPFVYVPLAAKPEKAEFVAMFGASSWEKSIVIDYVNGDTSRTIYVSNETVYFDVTIEDETHTTLTAKDAYTSTYVYVKDAENKVLGHFVNDGTTLVVSDGYEGTYVAGDDTLVVSGYGKATLNSENGTYVVSNSDDYTLGLYVENTYYEVVITEDEVTITKPMVTITFITNGFEETEPVSVNKNIEYTLPVLGKDTVTHMFMGWYLDEEFEGDAVTKITPSTDITVYAKWFEKVVYNLVDVKSGDPTTVYGGDGEKLSDVLPVYGVEEDIMKVFRGWYLDDKYEVPIQLNSLVSIDDTGIVLYAKWEDLPAYYGTYYGSNIYGQSSGNYGNQTLTIDENGKITSSIYKINNGIITKYSPESQVVTWKKLETETTEYKFYFDAESGVIAMGYDSDIIGRDYYFMCKELESTSGKAVASFGICAPGTFESTTIDGYYAQFIEITTGRIVFLYNNHIYSNPTITTSNGTVITTVAELKNIKTVIIKDNDTTILRLGTTEINFNKANTSNTKLLDNYFGSYTLSTDENIVVLDGVGGITYGNKTGSYTLATDSSYGFDVYLQNNTEYYRLTLSDNNYVIEMPMVTYHYVTGEGHPTVEDKVYNMNIKVTELPTVSHDGYAFKGWYTNTEYTTSVTTITPVEETTLYAKWNEIFTVTVYLGESEIESKELEDGECFVPTPTILADGKLIVGYYLDSAFENEYNSTSPITESMNIYAKSMLVAPEGVLSIASNGGKDKIKETNIYAWNITVNEDGTINLTSTNEGVASSESQFVVTFAKDSIVTFNYDVSSEGSSYDNLYVMIKENDKSTYTENAKYGSKDGITGTYTHTFHTGDSLALLYRKDSGGNKGRDNAIITNLTFTDGLPDAQLTYVYNDGVTENTTTTVSLGGYLTEELLSTPENVRDENSYRFTGWYVDANFTTKATASYIVTTENLTLYAKWDEKVTVTFVVPEGATTVEDMSVWTNEAFDITTTLMDGYIFRGWYTSSDYTDTTKYDLTKGVTETTILYAKFEETPVGSSFDKAKEVVVDFTNNIIKLENTVTTEDFQIYYIKLVVNAEGKYIFAASDAKRTGGNITYSYPTPKIALYASDKETLVSLNNEYSSYNAQLTTGTYYLLIHIYADPSKAISSSDTCWGTIGNITIETFEHDEVTEAVNYSLGNTLTIDTINSRDEKYVLSFTTTTLKTYQFDFSTNTSSIDVSLYSDETLNSLVFKTGYGTEKTEIVTLQGNTTYYLVISNNTSKLRTVTISTSEFSIKDVIATKVFSGDYKFYCGSSNWTATTTFTFDNNGNVVISSSSSDHDDWDSGCYKDSYSPSFKGSYTYTLDDTTLTLTNGTTTFVFTLDSADEPTKMTLSSTTLSSSSQGYFAVGTVFNLK